jgi:FixJ family two-component response regulator
MKLFSGDMCNMTRQEAATVREMSPNPGKIFIVDDDPSVGRALTRLFKAAGYQAEVFASAFDFLEARKHVDVPCCMVLDMKMPGLGGLELQEELSKEAYAVPIVFMTGYGDIPSSVRAMKQGAVTFLSKPVDDDVLILAVQEALTKDALHKQDLGRLESIQRRLASLTDREYEILTYVIAGLLNKQIASALYISEKTVKAHRGRVMTKMKAGSFADLVRMAGKAGIQPAYKPED